MEYLYEKEKRSFEDFSAGRVLYNQKGATAFPVRIASEVFARCMRYLPEQVISSGLTVYDPCCGGAFLLTSLGFLYGRNIKNIYASDADPGILELARMNLSLLNPEGMANRISEIEGYISRFGKDSHKEARESAERLSCLMRNNDINIECFQADALNLPALRHADTNAVDFTADLVITDFPYGNLVQWTGQSDDAGTRFLESLACVLKKGSIVAVISDKKTKISGSRYKRLEHFKIGVRKISIFELVDP